jgi:peptidoglycan/xylan/chitin deacetylase (PgdA/CDA1 family)
MSSLEHQARAPKPQDLQFESAAGSLLVCFDYEGRWGMPFSAPYDIESSTDRILEVLARHEVRATFFVVGELATKHRDLIRAISAAGHEIAVHGWRHERLERLSSGQLAGFDEGLAHALATIETITGAPPAGFRAPYLLAPRFFDATVYELLARRGFRWVSNREIRYVVELFRPDRLRSDRPWRCLRSRPRLLQGTGAQALLLALNTNVYQPGRRHPIPSPARWLLDGYPPFYRGGLLEIPIYSPLDCDLLGFPPPSLPSPQSLLDFARFALESCLARPGHLSMLTFHDWIIAGANRLALLDRVLSFIPASNVRPVTVGMWWARLQERRQSPAAGPF